MQEVDAKKPALKFNRRILDLDVEKEVDRIVNGIRETTLHLFRRRGAVIGVSGGIDSAVVLALSVRALGPDRVVSIMMPEKESSPVSLDYGVAVSRHYGVKSEVEDISPALEGLGCYQRRNEAIQRVFPDFMDGWSTRIVLPDNLLEEGGLNIFQLVVISPDGQEYRKRLPLHEFLQITSASNFKQRTRMAVLYYQAELRNYLVIGTENKNEHELGFFVKYGDAGVDINPIRHLFKTQIYQLAKYLNVPKEIQERVPTTDTYPGGGSQEEFFYRVPFDILDTIWSGYENGCSYAEIAGELELSPEQVERVERDIVSKQRSTAFLRAGQVTF